MNFTLLLYLADILESMKMVTGIIITIFIISTAICIFIWCLSNDGHSKELNDQSNNILGNIIKKSWIFFLVLIFNIAIPGKTTMYLMLGSSYLSNSNMPVQVSEIINIKLRDALKQLKKE